MCIRDRHYITYKQGDSANYGNFNRDRYFPNRLEVKDFFNFDQNDSALIEFDMENPDFTNIDFSKLDLSKLFTKSPHGGCQHLAYIGEDKPILFKFKQIPNEELRRLANESYMILSIGTENTISFLEANELNRDLEKFINYWPNLKKHGYIFNDVDYYITQSRIRDSKGEKKLGIRNLHPIIYGVYRFKESFGVHFLLSQKDEDSNLPINGWEVSHWNPEEYLRKEKDDSCIA